MVALHLVAELKKCSETRSSLLFQSTTVCKDLENYVAILRFFALSFQQVVLLTETLDEKSLFPSLDCEYSSYHGMLKGIESLDASCFYGRSFGFQFAPSVTSIFNVIGIILATYSLSWESGTAALCIVYLMKYERMTLLQAYHYVKAARPIIRPKVGFFKQMVEIFRLL
ncbi:hypothetical protein M3Y94_00483700 [Aphelenchoides besseyi]|nr:hypothetical protein M3Y94_00483700 [Aphelenchoides besseyi]